MGKEVHEISSTPDAPDWIYRVKRLVPAALWNLLSRPYWWWYNRASHRLAMVVDLRRKRSVERIRRYKNLHRGERCFVLGNGPSLRETDLSLLARETTFGLNRIYLNFPKMGFETTYYVAVNTLVVEQCAEDILSLQMPRFISWRGRKWLPRKGDIIYIDTDYTDPATFAKDATGRIYEGSTVTYVALQLAYYMGFSEVILVGVDHSFVTQGDPNVTVRSRGEDLNHFSKDYFGEGFRWQLPDLDASEHAYRLAKAAFDADGRKIVDATIGGQLQVFKKVPYHSLFQ